MLESKESEIDRGERGESEGGREKEIKIERERRRE